MKNLLLILFLFSSLVYSQNDENLIILNEGYYDFNNQEIIEPASIGVYYTSTEFYEEVAVIEGVRFASDMIVNEGFLYVAADNKILKYQIGSFELLNEVEVQGARNLLIHNDNLFVSRGDYDYDTWSAVVFDSYLHVYDKNDLTFVSQFDSSNGPAWSTQNLVIKDDQVFVAINNGFEWNNEKGLIGVIDANNLTYTNEFDLGDNGTNPDNMVLKGDYLLTVNNKNWSGSSVSRVNLITNEVVTEDLADISTGCGTSALRGDFLNYQVSGANTVQKYDYENMETVGEEEGINLNFYEIAEGSDNLFYASSTDFSSYGEVYIFNQNNEVVSSFSTGISPGTFQFYSNIEEEDFNISCNMVSSSEIINTFGNGFEVSSNAYETNIPQYVVINDEVYYISFFYCNDMMFGGGNCNELDIFTSNTDGSQGAYVSTGSLNILGSVASFYMTYEDAVCSISEGCTDENACNYNSNVGLEDGSCIYAEMYYDCNDVCLNDMDEDGVCDELEILGCTDSTACNYSADASDNDGSCTYADSNEDCEGNCVDGYTQMYLNYDSVDKSIFSISVYPVEEIYSATISGSGILDSCFPTELENECLAVEISGDISWSLSWIGTGGNLNEYLNSETVSDYATYNSDNGYYFGELCGYFAGCTDELACNYNNSASFNDGSCIYPEENEDCDGGCVIGYTQMILNYDSVGESSFNVSVFEGVELYSAIFSEGDLNGVLDSCFPTDLENECLAVEISGDLSWALSWVGLEGNLNEYLNSETIGEFATHENENVYYFGEACEFSSLEESVSHFNIFPNPSTSLVNISGNFSPKTKILIFNNIGKLVIQEITDNDVVFDFSNLSKGMYFINIISGEVNTISPILIK